MNVDSSFAVLACALGFIVFGYLSLVRLCAKQHFNNLSPGKWWRYSLDESLLSNLGSAALFVSLPATSLMLFWGWGPALLWLLVFHLIIETLFHLRLSAPANSPGIAQYLLRKTTTWQALTEQGFIQAFFLLSMAAVTALLATLIDRQSGLLFALLFLLPARSMLRSNETVLPRWIKISSAIAFLVLGVAVSNQLGFSIYGDWAPAGDWLAWLNFRNPTVIALVLVIAVFKIEKDPGFKADLSQFSGAVIVVLLLAMAVFLSISQPLLDAPLTVSESSPELASFWGLNLLLFTGFASLVIRLLNEQDNQKQRGADQFVRLQVSGLIYTIFFICLLLSLASALGIGAWKSHYLQWTNTINILEHLNLAITSTLVLLGSEAGSGSVLHTILLMALCIAGFGFMLNCANQLSLEESDKPTLTNWVVESKLPQAVIIFLGSCYFIYTGISSDVWIFIGMFAWYLVCHLGLGMCLEKPNANWTLILVTLLVTVLIGGGALAIGAQSLRWLVNGDLLFALPSIVFLFVCGLLWWRDCLQLPVTVERKLDLS